jgi:hypothetical protein
MLTNRTLLVSSGALILAIACGGTGGSEIGGTGSGGAGGTLGRGGAGATSIGGRGGAGATSTGDAGGTLGTGGSGGQSTPPVQDPSTGAWMCSDASGTHICQCSDGIDNDGDQTIDLLDPNCANNPSGDSEQGSTSGGNCGTTQCSNCIDDDGDGLIDSADPECTGARDNDERSFATGIPGDNVDACKQDCFFDGNSGQGDDGCDWELQCDPANPGKNTGCPYNPDSKCKATQSDRCIKYCSKFTPNGCDCFGCCTVYVNNTPHDVILLSGCSVDKIGDPAACPTCTKETSCNNPCGPCEYCLGRPPSPDCTQPPPDAGTGGAGGYGGMEAGTGGYSGQCPVGVTACTPGADAVCPAGFYCLTGCCSPIVVIR